MVDTAIWWRTYPENRILICAKKEENASSFCDQRFIECKVETLEAESGTPLKKKEKDSLKKTSSSIFFLVLSAAVTSFARSFPEEGFIVVDAIAATQKAEDIASITT